MRSGGVGDGPVLLRPGHPSLVPSTDPARSRARLSAGWWDADGPVAAAASEARSLLARHGAALASRTTAPGHLTGSALVVDATGERVLVLHHTKLRRWLQPGGHADGDHELAGVALREAAEETGLDGLGVLVPAVDVDLHRVDHGDALGEHLHLDVRFVVVAPPGAVARGNHESTALAWVTPSELEELADEEGLVRLCRAGLAALAAWRDAGSPEG